MVSVIIPMRNAAGTIARTIGRLLQTDAVTQVVVVDDGSTDGSRAAVEAIADDRVEIIDGPCAGIGAAVNAGFLATTAQYVTRCDADDFRPAEAIAYQADWLADHPEFGAICGGFATFARDTGPRVLVTPNCAPSDITRDLLRGRTWTHLNSFLVRRECWDRAGPLRNWFESAEDIDFQLRLAEAGRVWFDPNVAYEYRLTDGSITHRQASTRRVFFENAARHFALQRRERGADDLSLGRPPMPPPDIGSPLPASRQFARHLLGAAARSWRTGDRAAAIRAAAGACRRLPLSVVAWRTLASVSLKTPPIVVDSGESTLIRPRRPDRGPHPRPFERSTTPRI